MIKVVLVENICATGFALVSFAFKFNKTILQFRKKSCSISMGCLQDVSLQKQKWDLEEEVHDGQVSMSPCTYLLNTSFAYL